MVYRNGYHTECSDARGLERESPGVGPPVAGDELAHLITLIAAATLLLITALLVYQLWILSAEARAKFGWAFL